MRELLTSLLLALACTQVVGDEYRVSLDEANLRLARVEARLYPTADGELLLLRDAEDSGIEGGWARFVESLEVVDSAGGALEVERPETGRFRLGGAVQGPVTVRYTMRLGHDQVPNLPGADELAWARSDAVLWTGRAIFFEGAPASEIEVSFTLPEGWRATTPWQVVDPGRRFRAADTDALLDSAFIAGTHYEATLGEGPDARVRIALAGDGAIGESQRIVATVDHYLKTFARLFDTAPEGRLLLVAADGDFWGGGVMGTTISMMLGGMLDASTLPMLRFVTVHELFHLWNANFSYAGEEGVQGLYWMTEGTASYYTMRSQLGHGELPEEVVFGQLAEEVSKYLESRGELSMVGAGPEKLQHYDLIYSGGFVASMALDIAIRSGSAGRSSLDDVMRSLGSGDGARVALDVERFAELVESTTGVAVDHLVDCCVAGTAELPLVDLFAELGLELRLETPDGVEVAIDPDAEPRAAAGWLDWPLP